LRESLRLGKEKRIFCKKGNIDFCIWRGREGAWESETVRGEGKGNSPSPKACASKKGGRKGRLCPGTEGGHRPHHRKNMKEGFLFVEKEKGALGRGTRVIVRKRRGGEENLTNRATDGKEGTSFGKTLPRRKSTTSWNASQNRRKACTVSPKGRLGFHSLRPWEPGAKGGPRMKTQKGTSGRKNVPPNAIVRGKDHTRTTRNKKEDRSSEVTKKKGKGFKTGR